MAIARIVHHWTDGSVTELEVDSGDDAAHPDLLDMLVRRVLTLYRETCTTASDEEQT